ncbi:hypothetical protein BDZ94DRAFT_440597 [Collybia nuda]|uniref:G domain-containing protein n=1 Tax=Collybia nuda TaxID=64659 RepID=A0A9P5YBG0_9AGAR|nr:hypothetical protein BDZ94DRAFT_440597 [Collybia nuda]
MVMGNVNTKGDHPIPFDGRPTDVIICPGSSRCWESTFTNALCESHTTERAKVGHCLDPCTVKLQPVIISPSFGGGKGRRWVIVDTPGFEDTYVDEPKALKLISDWLAMSYKQVSSMKLAGMIYLHDISQNRNPGTIHTNSDIFHKLLCGYDAPSVIVPCTTKWGNIEVQIGSVREGELAKAFWEKMTPSRRFHNDPESTWEFATYLLERKMKAAVRRIENLNADFPLLPYVSPNKQTDSLYATDLVVLCV